MIQTTLSGLITLLLAKFILNDVPHAFSEILHRGEGAEGHHFVPAGTTMYHATPYQRWSQIKATGLEPRGWTLRAPAGVYLATSKEAAREYIRASVPSDAWVILKVTIPEDTIALQDPAYGPGRILPIRIPSNRIELLETLEPWEVT